MDEHSPQVFDQGLREESFTFLHIVLLENFEAGQPDFFEKNLQFLAELAGVSAFFGDCREND